MTDQQTEEHRDLADVPEMGEADEEVCVPRRAWIGRFLGPRSRRYSLLRTHRNPENGLSQGSVATVSVGVLMAVATPPNAIVFGSGHITIVQMVRAGIWLNIIGAILVTLTVFTLARWVFGFGLG